LTRNLLGIQTTWPQAEENAVARAVQVSEARRACRVRAGRHGVAGAEIAR
jgi:hypothetical protein